MPYPHISGGYGGGDSLRGRRRRGRSNPTIDNTKLDAGITPRDEPKGRGKGAARFAKLAKRLR